MNRGRDLYLLMESEAFEAFHPLVGVSDGRSGTDD
jgi:hypothetical protein